MQINSSEMNVFSQDSDEFLHQKIEWQSSPVKPRQSEEHQQTPKKSKNHTTKSRGIVKQSKQGLTKTKIPKKHKDETNITKMGRPQNQKIQEDHLEINRSYNDIVYHFSRMMIFLKFKQGIQTSNCALMLENSQSAWISQTQEIMNQQNFPTFQEQKPLFLLHPNSLHYVLYYLKQKGKDCYKQQEMKYMLFAFLIKREMLTSIVYDYVTNYWSDIIYLVNNPEGDEQNLSQRENQIAALNITSSDLLNQQIINSANRKQENVQSQSSKQKKRCTKQDSQIQNLKKQLQEDDSIAAYQISCYLHACCLKFQIKIRNNC